MAVSFIQSVIKNPLFTLLLSLLNAKVNIYVKTFMYLNLATVTIQLQQHASPVTKLTKLKLHDLLIKPVK